MWVDFVDVRGLDGTVFAETMWFAANVVLAKIPNYKNLVNLSWQSLSGLLERLKGLKQP